MKTASYILGLYMLFGSMMPGMDFSQLAAISSLSSHYSLHIANAEPNEQVLSFLDFLVMHFVETNQHEDHDHDQAHEALPFHTVSLCISLLIDGDNPMDSLGMMGDSSRLMSMYHPIPLDGFKPSIFHPPICLA